VSLQRQPRSKHRRFVTGLLAVAFIAVALTASGEPGSALAPGSSTPSRSIGPSADQKLRQGCEQGNPALVEAAIADKADVNCSNPVNGLPPLLEMLRSATATLDPARRECVACLLAHGAKPSVADSDQRTAVIYATRLGDLDTLRLLVEAEAFVRTRDRFHNTALFYAVEADRRDIVLYLSQNGALISLSVAERRQMSQR
jgi:ankyrin repeat protein